MRHRAVCWIVALVTATLAGATLGAQAASADVTMSPGEAVQGGAAKLTFRVTEDRVPAYTTRIELLMPESAPVAETYPMSDPQWAPRMTMRKVDQSLGGIHHGQVTEVVASIVWTRAGAPAPGGGPAELVVSLGPLPQTDQMTFHLVQTYSDGHVTNWNQPPSSEVPRPEFAAPVLTLAPPAAEPAPPGAAVPQREAADDDGDSGFGSLTTGLVAGLILGLAVAAWLYLRRPRTGTAGPAPSDSAGPAPSDSAGSTGPTGTTGPDESDESDESSESVGGSGQPAVGGPAEPAAQDTRSGTRAASGGRTAGGGRAWRLRE
ncbi:DUF1775 domain-containing protein [Micromonospora sp. WMMD1102]|uniref:YcnI family copper-binding membrane protein n=1 Tax=Micromonospora sp. WMMD1102 TaxID=3016105 RepID=UPI002414FA59|nr:DUF1775 domain-containing protein [Micromonospora sp. WMMD1102]MDG4787454.1 DUF1775 domain-containing protein [Micromonospora sp. WMMD1102]